MAARAGRRRSLGAAPLSGLAAVGCQDGLRAPSPRRAGHLLHARTAARPAPASTLRLSTPDRTVPRGEKIKIRGRLSPAEGGEDVEVRVRRLNGAWLARDRHDVNKQRQVRIRAADSPADGLRGPVGGRPDSDGDGSRPLVVNVGGSTLRRLDKRTVASAGGPWHNRRPCPSSSPQAWATPSPTRRHRRTRLCGRCRRRIRPCARRSSATATGSCTRRRSGGSSTRRRSSSRPEGDHYRTRLTHTLETCMIARTVARALGLNEDLTEAVALGHDLGHPPFGHIGESVLDACMQRALRHRLPPQRALAAGRRAARARRAAGST